MLAIDESVSIDWARVVRGMASVEKAVIRRCGQGPHCLEIASGINEPR